MPRYKNNFLFIFFGIIGYKASSNFGYLIGKFIGPFFRSKFSIINNLKKARINENYNHKKISSNILGNYGRIFAEYVHLKNFKNNKSNVGKLWKNFSRICLFKTI